MNSSLMRTVALRGGLLMGVWLALSLGNPDDIFVGLLAALLATWASLHLMPPQETRASMKDLAGLVARFLYQSVVAGFDVAVRVFDPRLPLETGTVVHRSRLPGGPGFNGFFTMASLQPGTLPASTEQRDAVVVHCLDTSQPVVTGLELDEAKFARAFGVRQDDV
jgi:multicomponent Na+:H+ antiporter subunit E